MAPTIHPPCTPAASCTPTRCHPTAPPCKDPEKCLLAAINKGTKPCASAVSILSTTAKLKCSECSGKEPVKPNAKMRYIEDYLEQKKKEVALLKIDRLTGSNRYAEYIREKNNPKKNKKKGQDEEPCCQGKGHRGWLQPSKPGKKKGKKGADPTLRSLKPCAPIPSCSVHKCRHRQPRCPDPDACYSKCKSLGVRCPHAVDVVNPRGKDCTCVDEVSQSMRIYRPGEDKRAKMPYKKWVDSLYTKRSKVSRWVDDDDDTGGSKKSKKGKKKKGRCDIL